MKKVNVIYTTKHPIADHKVEEWFEKVKNQNTIYFSNQIQLLKLRVEHLKKNISIEKIDINNDFIYILEDGNVDHFPENFFDVSFKLAKQIAKLIK